MSFLPPSNRTAVMPFIQSDLGLSNLIDTINRINNAFAIPLSPSVTPYWLLGQVKEFSDGLDSYIIAGGDPYKQLWSLHFCRVLSDATVEVLRLVNRQAFVDDDDIIQTMKEVVIDVTAITETLGHSAFGDNLECSWHGFIVNHVCINLFGGV